METPNTLKSRPVYHTPVDLVHSSPCGSGTPKPMSASLKERLKRTRRSFHSPCSVVKRLKVDPDEEVTTTSSRAEKVTECAKTSNPESKPERVDINRNQVAHKACSESGSGGSRSDLSPRGPVEYSQTDLLHLRAKLKKEVGEKTEKLRRLKMAEMYRSKNDLTQLQCLISKWRRCSQEVLFDLQSVLLIDGRKASISQLMDHFGLEDRMLHFERTEDDFTDP
ncbi:hypothetical protein AAFF_G00364250 [Aldrovandia affinis]|uniref:Swi5-dependent recombination DNA repair protein 1 homolog n=1 Tax=Aldrovandia affinis TaxID=143900 RepID=A0AAD7SI70_9TELE|nr:hypothetical protein AAFF_G00364250 [Aldrovandia affinis]